MNAPQNKPKSKVVSGILISLILGINIIRVLVGMNRQPVATQTMTPDEIYQLTGHAVTAEQSEREFDQKYGHGDLARMKEVEQAVAASHANP